MQYVISGRVERGDGYGRKIGFPTINLNAGETTKELPPVGVYAGIVLLDGKEYRAGVVVGPNYKIDAHLLGYNANAYGKEATFKINKFLREYKKFNTEEELIIQIKKDMELC